jgi:hypothetical protein
MRRNFEHAAMTRNERRQMDGFISVQNGLYFPEANIVIKKQPSVLKRLMLVLPQVRSPPDRHYHLEILFDRAENGSKSPGIKSRSSAFPDLFIVFAEGACRTGCL